MAEKKSFNQAFAEARKAGLKTFKWNGNYYGTKLKSEVTAAQHTSTGKKGTARFGGKAKTTKDKNDNFNGGVMDELVIVAPYKKIDRKTSGFIPVDERTDLVDRNGNSRVYFNTNNRMYYVTDNYGNIIGTTLDEKAKNNGYKAFTSYTGSKNDLIRSGSAQLADRAMMNEVNQLDRQKRDRQGKELIEDMNNAKTGFVNVVSQLVNLPNHAVMGAARLLASPDYKSSDYIQGFNLNQSNKPLNQTVGLGDVLEIKNEPLRFALNTSVNAYTLPQAKMRLPKQRLSVIEGRPANIPQISNTKPVSNFRRGRASNEGMGNGRFGGRNHSGRGGGYNTQTGGNHYFGNNQQGSVAKMPSKILRVDKVSGYFDTPTTPYHPIVGDLITRNQYQRPSNPFQVEYNGETNRTLKGRLNTGDFVPGTTAPTWGNGNGSVKVRMSGGEYAPGLGGMQMSNDRGVSVQGRVLRGDNLAPVSRFSNGGVVKKRRF